MENRDKVKKGVTYNSRRESNFINRMSAKDRDRYIRHWIASCNVEMLTPFVKVTKHDKYFREIEYEIVIPNNEYKGDE